MQVFKTWSTVYRKINKSTKALQINKPMKEKKKNVTEKWACTF